MASLVITSDDPVDTTTTVSLSGNGIQPRSIGDDFILHPLSFSLSLFPNPFNSRTAVRYAVPSLQRVRLTLYDINGRLVRTLVDDYRASGEHSVALNGRDLPAGIYFIRLAGGGEVRMEKVVLVR